MQSLFFISVYCTNLFFNKFPSVYKPFCEFRFLLSNPLNVRLKKLLCTKLVVLINITKFCSDFFESQEQ